MTSAECSLKGADTRLGDLPEECISQVLAHLETPSNVAQLATTSRLFLGASLADTVWNGFLPHGWAEICERAGLARSSSKRELFLRLCNEFLLEEGSHESMWLDRSTGAISRRLFARALNICWGDTEAYWRWFTFKSADVAYLKQVCWLDVRGRIEGTFTPGVYTLSWRLGLADRTFGWSAQPIRFFLDTSDGQHHVTDAYLNPPDDEFSEPSFSSIRQCQDGWLEYDVADFAVSPDHNKLEVAFGLWEHGGHWKGGLYVEGVIMRPRHLVPPSSRPLAPTAFHNLEMSVNFLDVRDDVEEQLSMDSSSDLGEETSDPESA